MCPNADAPRPLEILIIEDNRDARTTMRLLLTIAHGYSVHEAPDGASGVRVALERKPDVALIDLGLPDLHGHEVARRIRAALDRDTILLIALTGYGTAEDQSLAREAGFDFHLLKPVESSQLVKILEEHARRSSGTAS